MAVKQFFRWLGAMVTSTVIDDIWPFVLYFSAVAAMVTLVSELTSVKLQMNSVTISVLATVVSLIVSFQTNNSYARWWEGRNCWASLTTNSRQLAMLIWVGVQKPKPKPKDDPKTTDASKGGEDPKGEGKQGDSGQDGAAKGSGATGVPMGDSEDDAITLLIEKTTYINLASSSLGDSMSLMAQVQAYSAAMKHALRGETGPYYSDLYNLIAFLPQYRDHPAHPSHDDVLDPWRHSVPSEDAVTDDTYAVPLTAPAPLHPRKDNRPAGDAEAALSPPDLLTQGVQRAQHFAPPKASPAPGDDKQKPKPANVVAQPVQNTPGVKVIQLLPPRHPPSGRIYDWFPFLRAFKAFVDMFKTEERVEKSARARGGKRIRPGGVDLEIPRTILAYLSLYVSEVLTSGAINSSLAGPMVTCLLNLSTNLSDLEKLSTTPLPSAYQAHLRLTVWCYLFFLPFQLYEYLGWITIPATAVASLTYLGFLEIGGQISEPFQYDTSDLDLDKYVLRIANELAQITAFPTSLPMAQLPHSDLNQPFLPALSTTAKQLLAHVDGDSPPHQSSTRAASGQPRAACARKSVAELETALIANARDATTMQSLTLEQQEEPTGVGVAVALL